jgi:hypothetical protein
MNVEQRLQVLADTFQISELKARYCNGSDSGWGGLSNDADSTAQLFVEDRIYDAGAFGFAKV